MAANISRENQIKEIIRCGNDPQYFFKKYCKIQHPTKGTIPFTTYNFQDDCIEAFTKHKFNIILKSRQLGLSTLTAAYAAWLSLFYKDQNILIIATKQKTAQNLMRKVKFIIVNLPPWLMITQIVANNKQEVEFGNGSVVKAVSTSADAGRSEALSLLLIDECAFIQNFDELWMGLYPTLSTGGRAIIFSTPNGVGGKYYELYTQAEQGLNEFNPIKLTWNVHPEHTQEWFDKQTRNMNAREIAQEMNCDFAASGETFMGADEILAVGKFVRPPNEKIGDDRNCWIWESPKRNHSYIMSADVARGDGKDFSTFHVIDVDEGEVVCEYKGRMLPDKFAEFMIDVGTKYNTALICPENNSYGYAVILKLRELEYQRLYYRNNPGVLFSEYIPPDEAQLAGIETNSKTRPAMLSKLEEVLRHKQLKIFSSRFYEELKTFVWTGVRAQAMKGHNDDLVMSLAIGTWLFDTSHEYSQQSVAISKALFSAMGVSRKQFIPDDPTGTTLWDKAIDISGSPSYTKNRARNAKKWFGWV